MRIRIAPRSGGVPADGGAPEIPTSKSHAQRALCLAAWLPGGIEVDDLPASGDVQVLQAALREPAGAVRDLRDNGTALRILSVLPALLGESCTLDGKPRLRERPLRATEEFLGRYGGRYTTEWPRTFDGTAVAFPEELEVDARLTTQVATGVLLGAAIRTAHGVGPHVVRVRAPAAPDYLLVTLEVLAWFGFALHRWWEDGDLIVEISEWQAPAPGHRVRVPVDASSASFVTSFRAMHGLAGGPAAPAGSAHPDWLFGEDLERLLAAPPQTELVFWELGRRPDTFPCMATMAALRSGRTRFCNIPALRHKESDRIRAMALALTALGVRCDEHPDGLTVTGPVPARAAVVGVPTPDDHRIVMAVSLLGTRLPGGIEVDNAEAVAKSWPGFFDWLGRVSELTWL